MNGMRHITVNTARNEFDTIIDQVMNHGDSVSIANDDGAVILVSQEEWSGLLETLYLQSIPGMSESIREARETPESERLEDIGWVID
jgi:PHD/YefM family antitoxin component YafN of YafNO toxin-antitoxin module